MDSSARVMGCNHSPSRVAGFRGCGYNAGVSLPFGPTLARSLALVGLPNAEDLRAQLQFARGAGYRGAQLNAAAPGVRPRELDRSARRDIAALLSRHELALSGVDLWIPAEDFENPQRADRASAALADAIRFASEMATLAGSRAVMSCVLPAREEVRDHARSVAESVGCVVADHAWPAKTDSLEGGAIGVGIDPAAVLLAEGKAGGFGRMIAGIKSGIASARLSDMDSGGRTEAGAGHLDLMSYEATLVTVGYPGMLVVDCRGLADPAASAGRLARV